VAVVDFREEHVLVIPTSLLHERAGSGGLFQGFTPQVERFLPWLFEPVHLCYLPRSQAEDDPGFKQLIPYVVLRFGDQVFHYTRGKAGTEARLRSLRSLGVGGHICREDGGTAADPYRAGLLRELAEEVVLDSSYQERILGLINDDRTSVGQVHLGIVHLLDLGEPRVARREDALADCGFAPLEELRRQRSAFETWSQFLLDGDWLNPSSPT
jgi:predicted NUDIX family phosphoesterase